MIQWVFISIYQTTPKTKKCHLIWEKLFMNAEKLQNEMYFGNTSKVKKSFSSRSAIIVAINELKKSLLFWFEKTTIQLYQ